MVKNGLNERINKYINHVQTRLTGKCHGKISVENRENKPLIFHSVPMYERGTHTQRRYYLLSADADLSIAIIFFFVFHILRYDCHHPAAIELFTLLARIFSKLYAFS